MGEPRKSEWRADFDVFEARIDVIRRMVGLLDEMITGIDGDGTYARGQRRILRRVRERVIAGDVLGGR